jgi:hypothetical protein
MHRLLLLMSLLVLAAPAASAADEPKPCAGYHQQFFTHFLNGIDFDVSPKGLICSIALSQNEGGRIMAIDTSRCAPEIRDQMARDLATLSAFPVPQQPACWAQEVELVVQVLPATRAVADIKNPPF